MEKISNRLWTVKETAELFRRSVDTIYRWIQEDTFTEVIKVRDGYYIPDREIQRLLREGQIKNKD